MTFPSPIGGTPLPIDFAPSILFAILYALLLPAALYRNISKRSRSTLLIGTTAFAIERVIIFSLRAAQSRDEAKRDSKGLTSYMQVSFGLGFTSIAQDLLSLLRCLLVNSTYGSPTDVAGPTSSELALDPLPKPSASTPVIAEGDRPRQRSLYRRFSGILQLGYWAVTIVGSISGSQYSGGMGNQNTANSVMRLRLASSALALFLILLGAFAVLWAVLQTQRVNTKAAIIVIYIYTLLIVVTVYQLSIMHNTTTALDSTNSSSLNSSGAKAVFYVLHISPEWIAVASLFSMNTREVFATGPFGDYRSRDETPEEKEKKLQKKEKKKEKRRRSEMAEGLTV